MARLFVYSDDLSVRVEVMDTTSEGDYAGKCSACDGDPLGSRVWYRWEDAVAAAELHADVPHREAAP